MVAAMNDKDLFDASSPFCYPKDAVDYEVNKESLREMEEVVPMTGPERKKLRVWVRSGHDVESNPWGYLDEDGFQLNYLQAYRLEYGYSAGPWDSWRGPELQSWLSRPNGIIFPYDDNDLY